MLTSAPSTVPTTGEADSLLHPGDWLDTAEFMRRYELSPQIKKAELVDNVVYMNSPVSFGFHSRPHIFFLYVLAHYESLHEDCEAANDTTWIIDEGSTVQPDCFLRYKEGSCWLDERSFLHGAPELVVEISASTVSIDSHQKRRKYERAGVREYIIWRVMDNVIDFWRLDEETKSFRASPPDTDGIWSSAVFPGLILDLEAVLKMNHKAAIRLMK